MNTTIESLEQRNMRTDLPQFNAGVTLRVHFKANYYLILICMLHRSKSNS